MELNEKLANIQSKLKAPKSQRNNFGNYNYRNCEDILEAVKPLLLNSGLTLTISDDIIMVGSRVYVKATATLSEGREDNAIKVSAFARESETKKGMDDSQITGSASSYARKYALNGLFLIDDTKDADSMDNSTESKKSTPAKKESAPELKPATDSTVKWYIDNVSKFKDLNHLKNSMNKKAVFSEEQQKKVTDAFESHVFSS